jgi:hypothetical protein
MSLGWIYFKYTKSGRGDAATSQRGQEAEDKIAAAEHAGAEACGSPWPVR